MYEMVIIISYKCLSLLEKFKLQQQCQCSVCQKKSPGTTDDLTGRGERMQKPHVQQPAVNSKYVVSLAGHCIFFRVHRQFVSNKKKASSLACSLSLSGSEETPFSHFVSDYFEAVCCSVHRAKTNCCTAKLPLLKIKVGYILCIRIYMSKRFVLLKTVKLLV